MASTLQFRKSHSPRRLTLVQRLFPIVLMCAGTGTLFNSAEAMRASGQKNCGPPSGEGVHGSDPRSLRLLAGDELRRTLHNVTIRVAAVPGPITVTSPSSVEYFFSDGRYEVRHHRAGTMVGRATLKQDRICARLQAAAERCARIYADGEGNTFRRFVDEPKSSLEKVIIADI